MPKGRIVSAFLLIAWIALGLAAAAVPDAWYTPAFLVVTICWALDSVPERSWR